MGSEYRQLPGFGANFAGATTNIERDAPAVSTVLTHSTLYTQKRSLLSHDEST